jgi:hypothetical protein
MHRHRRSRRDEIVKLGQRRPLRNASCIAGGTGTSATAPIHPQFASIGRQLGRGRRIAKSPPPGAHERPRSGVRAIATTSSVRSHQAERSRQRIEKNS